VEYVLLYKKSYHMFFQKEKNNIGEL